MEKFKWSLAVGTKKKFFSGLSSMNNIINICGRNHTLYFNIDKAELLNKALYWFVPILVGLDIKTFFFW